MVTFDITPVGGSVGAEIRGLDVRDPDPAVTEALGAALLEHMVLFLPGQDVTREEHIAFGRRFGELEVFHPQTRRSDEDTHAEILGLRSEKGQIADVWHTDVTWTQSPPRASIVRITEVPSRGGDTMWSNQAAAFDALTEPMRHFLSGLSAVHTGKALGKPDARATHPVVRRHPDTGRACLYVNRQFTSHIVELSPGESHAILPYLFSWSEQPQFTCRYAWSEGTVAMWDNRCTQHYVVNDFEGARSLERVTVVGDHPEPMDELPWPAHHFGSVSAAASPAMLR